jgi:hypothetical protein
MKLNLKPTMPTPIQLPKATEPTPVAKESPAKPEPLAMKPGIYVPLAKVPEPVAPSSSKPEPPVKPAAYIRPLEEAPAEQSDAQKKRNNRKSMVFELGQKLGGTIGMQRWQAVCGPSTP